MHSLKQDFPDIAEEIARATNSNKALKDAMVDYEHACERLNDESIETDDRDLWDEIHEELIKEIRRILGRIGQKENTA